MSQLSPTLSPGRVYDLLLSGVLVPGLSIESDGGADDSPVDDTSLTVVLSGTEDEPVVPVTAAGGGFARLVGHVIRAAGVEAQRTHDGTHFRVSLPSPVAEWIADRSVLWIFLSGGWGVPQGGSGGQHPQRVDSSEALSLAADTPAWVVRLETVRYSGDSALSWMVVETTRRDADTSAGTGQPSRVVAAGIQRMRDLLTGLDSEATVSVRRQEPSAIPGGRTMMRLESATARVYWPVRSLRGMLAVLSGSDRADSIGHLPQLHALQRLIDLELSGYGLLRLLQTAPRTPEARRSRPALRTVHELVKSEGAPLRSLVDSAYRSGEAYQAAAVLSVWLSPAQQDQLRRAFGDRRWEQIHEHGLRRAPRRSDGAAVLLPGTAVAAAAEHLVADLSQRSQQPGRRPPAATVEIVRRFYTEPRGTRLREVWETQIRRGVLAGMLEEVFLSQLKRDLPRLPRETLVLAAVGEPQAVRDRISAVFSRRGRKLFAEDVAAATALVERGELTDWDRILAARSTLWGLYNHGRDRTRRTARHRRGAPERAGR
ncbi:MAG TPA: hypothetical protein VJ932_05935 [Alkalispirochaeta sp.]|nr:hypothetical protein [Alkalispirochaeta sp.]